MGPCYLAWRVASERKLCIAKCQPVSLTTMHVCIIISLHKNHAGAFYTIHSPSQLHKTNKNGKNGLEFCTSISNVWIKNKQKIQPVNRFGVYEKGVFWVKNM